jgi:hypothetical protein
MTFKDRVTAISAAAMLVLSFTLTLATVTPAAAGSRAAPSPFCLMRGGSNGPGSEPEICGFFDYRQCLQAAANLNANCVPNSDFRGVLPWKPEMAWGWR